MDDEIDDMIACGEILSATEAIEMAIWMSMSIADRYLTLVEYEQLSREWQEHQDENYGDWRYR